MVGQKLFREKIEVPIQTATVIALIALAVAALALMIAVSKNGG